MLWAWFSRWELALLSACLTVVILLLLFDGWASLVMGRALCMSTRGAKLTVVRLLLSLWGCRVSESLLPALLASPCASWSSPSLLGLVWLAVASMSILVLAVI